MTKAIMLMVLAVASSNAVAEWVQVGASELVAHYSDPLVSKTTSQTVEILHRK